MFESRYSRLLILLPLLFVMACIKNERIDIPDVEHLREELKEVPFTQQLLALDDTSALQQLISEYPIFSEVFAGQVLPPERGRTLMDRLDHFRQDTSVLRLQEEVQRIQPWSAVARDQLAQAFALARHYFPGFVAPKVYTCISLFEVGSFTIGEDILGIGLDFYLGESFVYNPSVFPEYISRTMSSEYLAPKSVQVILEQMIGQPAGNTALDHMIRNGIVLYLKEKLMPGVEATILHEFTREQMDWVENNEGEIWAYLVGEDLLHETSARKYRKLVSPSPGVPGMPDEAPGRVGNWLGYQIVTAYVQRTKVLPIEMVQEKDSQKVLTLAKYRPRRTIG